SRHHAATAVAFALTAATFAAVDTAAETLKPAGAKAATPYQAYLAADCPAGSNFCRFFSEEVPALEQLTVRRVACQGWTTGTTLPSFVVIAELRTGDGTFVERIDFLKTTYAPANGGTVWAIGESTRMIIPAGHKLRVSLNAGPTEVGSYGCTI